MKKTIVVLIAFLSFAMITNAQNSKIIGSWLAIKVEVEGQVQEPYQIMDYSEDGKMMMMGIELGSWEYRKSSNAIVMRSDFDKDFNGEAKILKLNKKELIVEKDGAKVFYLKLNQAEIDEENIKSDFVGTWRIEDSANPDLIQSLKFDLPDSFVLVEKDGGSTSTSKGTWIYSSKENTLIAICFSRLLRGKNTITVMAEDKFILNNNGSIVTALKEKVESNKIERLNFTDADFFDENGDYKYYEDEQKLPWQDPMEMSISLVNTEQLVYKYSTLIEGTGVFDSEILTANVHADPQEQALSIDFIFYGYDNYNLPEDTQLPPNNEFSRPLFPEKEGDFRIAKTEQIATPAGTFDCTVIDAVFSFDVRKRLWMINDKPGIYAKIIEDKAGDFGHYVVYELQEIKDKE